MNTKRLSGERICNDLMGVNHVSIGRVAPTIIMGMNSCATFNQYLQL